MHSFRTSWWPLRSGPPPCWNASAGTSLNQWTFLGEHDGRLADGARARPLRGRPHFCSLGLTAFSASYSAAALTAASFTVAHRCTSGGPAPRQELGLRADPVLCWRRRPKKVIVALLVLQETASQAAAAGMWGWRWGLGAWRRGVISYTLFSPTQLTTRTPVALAQRQPRRRAPPAGAASSRRRERHAAVSPPGGMA